MIDSAAPSFWEERYQSENMPWDCHGVPAEVIHFLKSVKPPGRVLIPGCGSAYEVKAFLEAGWDAWGIDFSEAAVKRAQGILGNHGDRILLGDFFTHEFDQPFDWVYERSFLCALPPRLRKAYACRISDLLVPEGRLVGFFLYGATFDGPPFPLQHVEEAKQLLCHFELIEDLDVKGSSSVSDGKERWEQWEKDPFFNQQPSAEEKQLLDQADAEYFANPHSASPWQEVKSRMLLKVLAQ